MHKKLITACFALVAFAAFVLPAAAQATNTPLLTEPTGTALNPASSTCTGVTGICITATNVGNTLMRSTTGALQLSCTSASMTGNLTTNTSGNVQGDIHTAHFTGTGAEGRCTGFVNATVDPLNLGTGAGQGWCIKSTAAMGTDEFQVFGGRCTEAAKKIEFTLTPSTGGKCRYQSTTTTAIKGILTTDVDGGTQDAVLHVPRTNLTGTPEHIQETKSTDTGFTKVEDTTIFGICPTSSYLEMSFTLETDTVGTDPIYISP